MTSPLRIRNVPSIEVDSSRHSQQINCKLVDARIERLLSLTDKMNELKKRSDSLDDLWDVYEKLDSVDLKKKVKAKINEKTQIANILATQIQQTLEMEETKKKLIQAKHETDRRITRSPLSSPTPRTSRAFFWFVFLFTPLRSCFFECCSLIIMQSLSLLTFLYCCLIASSNKLPPHAIHSFQINWFYSSSLFGVLELLINILITLPAAATRTSCVWRVLFFSSSERVQLSIRVLHSRDTVDMLQEITVFSCSPTIDTTICKHSLHNHLSVMW